MNKNEGTKKEKSVSHLNRRRKILKGEGSIKQN